MGWLELLALMKRVLPLLGRVAPLLESYAGARGAMRGDAEALDRFSADLQAQLAATKQNHVDVTDTLRAQNDRLQHLSDALNGLRTADAEQLTRLEQIERQVASSTRLLRVAFLLTITLLLACVGLLVALLQRH